MLFRKFNSKGVDAFQAYLSNARTDSFLELPNIHDHDQLTEVVEPRIATEVPHFLDRMDFADWLHNLSTENSWPIPQRDIGFWSWLTFVMLDQICPKSEQGSRKIRENAWYIPAFDDARRDYRHILYGSYSVYKQYKDDPEIAAVLLSVQLDTLGHVWFQLASRQELVTNPAVVGAATALYMDRSTRKMKRGAMTQNAGGIFRYVKLLNQLDRVWDLRLKGAKGILELLPKEFNKFKLSTKTTPKGVEH